MSDLKQQQSNLPEKPGVYYFLNHKNEYLYVGKAKNLKKRTKYYFKEKGRSKRFSQMISESVFLKFNITDNENEAFLLEAQLIKHKQPKYNIQYKSGRTLYYIVFSDHEYPRLSVKSSWEKDAIGPFLSYFSVKKLLEELLCIFQMRTCSDFSFNKRKRPCLEYFAKKCSAPCMKLIESIEYNKKVDQMKKLFNGNNKAVLKVLNEELKHYIKNEQFELAAKLRDNIESLLSLKNKQGIFFENVKRLDIVLFYENVFYIESIKDGAIINIEYRTYQENLEKQDILFSYYIEEPIYKIIGEIDIKFAKYTNKLTQTELKILSFAKDRFHNLRFVNDQKNKWKKILNLKNLEVVEAYDCSHYNGDYSLCGMVKWTTEEEKLTKEYKIWRYHKKTYNDLEILEYGLTQRGLQELPDMILIDGGKTQLDVAKKALYPYVNIFAYAKSEGRRGGILYNYDKEIIFVSDKDLSIFLERIRQAAHNWTKKNAMYRFVSQY